MSPTHYEVVSLETVPRESNNDRKPLLLIVDDEQLVADTLAAILYREGFEVMKAYNATSALQKAAQRTPDLMVTDVAMPGMNGVELATTMREVCPSTKTLLFSGQNASGKIVAGCGHQFRLLSKPLHPTTLIDYISRELGLPERTPRFVPNIASLIQAECA